MSGRKIIEGLSIDKHEFKLLISKMSHIKNKSSFCFYKTGFFSRFHTFFGCETKTGVVRILVVFFFQDMPVFSHIIQKVSTRAFHWCG